MKYLGRDMATKYGKPSMQFLSLDSTAEFAFRDSARKNYQPFSMISGIWHPTYQEECVTINREHSIFIKQGE